MWLIGVCFFRVDDVRQPPAVRIDMEIAVVARSGQRMIGQRNDDLRITALQDLRLLDADAPSFAAFVFAAPAQFAADFHQIVFNTQAFQMDASLSTRTFRNRGKVEICAGDFFGQRLFFTPAGQDDFICTNHGGSLPDLLVRRFAGNGFVRPEAPQIHQRPDGNVQRALGKAVQTEGFGGNEGKIVEISIGSPTACN